MDAINSVAQAPHGPLSPGAMAPDFSLQSTPDQTVSVGDTLGYPPAASKTAGMVENSLISEFMRL